MNPIFTYLVQVKVNFIFLLLFFSLESALAQDHNYIQYTTKEGLPTDYVYGVVEDDNGYIWAYTENGLSKFDGYTFKNYTTKDGLPGNDIPLCVKDKEGKIWLDIYNNKPAYLQDDTIRVVYDVPCGFSSLKEEDGVIRYACSDVKEIKFTEDKMEYIQYGLIDSVLLSQEANSFKLDSVNVLPKIWNKDSVIFHSSSHINITKDSVYYFSQRFPISAIVLKNASIYYFSKTGMLYWKNENQRKSFFVGFHQNHVTACYKLPFIEKYIFVFEGKSLMFFDLNEEKTELIEIEKEGFKRGEYIWIKLMDRSFLIGSSLGFLEYDFEAKSIDKLLLKELADRFLLLNSFKDSKDNIWIGSRDGGLFFIPNEKRKTSLLTSSYFKDKTFEQLLSTEDGKLLAITDNSGVYQIKEDTIFNLLKPNKKNRFCSAINTPNGIMMSSSRKDNIIINNENDFSFPCFNCKHSDVKSRDNSFPNNPHLIDYLYNRNTLAFDQNRNILYSHFKGNIFSYQFLNNKKTQRSVFLGFAEVLYYHPLQKKVYLGNTTGLFYIEGEQLIPFLESYEVLKNVSSIYSIRNQLWIGTDNNGLFVYDFSKKELSKIQDVPMIRRIRPDTDTTLLVASNGGVFICNNNTKLFSENINYTINDGLSSNEIQDVYSDGSRFIYVASIEGVQKIDRTINYKTSLLQKDLSITNIQINKKNHLLNVPLDLSHLENTIDISYHLFSYASNSNMKYYTKLEPLETQWRETNARQVNYLSLASNEYVFHLKAKDIYGEEVILNPLKFVIREAYWQTVWFKMLIAILGIGVLLGFLIYRDKQNRRKLEKQKEINRRMAELELSALKAQMNPHFVFNALGAIQYFIQTNEVEVADNYLTRFARLMRKYLDSSKEKMISLKDEIELLNIYTELEKLRFEDLFGVEIKIADDLQIADEFIPSMILQPFVENAINHGLNERRDKKGWLQISFYNKNNTLFCEIKDNGIGRKNAEKNKWKGHKSRGMTIINEKIQTLKSSGLAEVSIEINDLEPKSIDFPGTHVILKIKNLEDE